MSEPHEAASSEARRKPADRLALWELFVLIAAVSIALVVTRPLWKADYKPHDGDPIEILPVTLRVFIAVLGGVSLAGPPLLLARRARRRTPWGPGRIVWFAHGASAWLLWPPIVAWHLFPSSRGMPWSSVCWLWGTPLMSVYLTAALLMGGWLGRRGRRRARRAWSEQFGLLLACLWACTGLYLLALLYWIDVVRRP